MDKLSSVFEKHQYYNISHLVRLTNNQPIVSSRFAICVCLCVGGGGGGGIVRG